MADVFTKDRLAWLEQVQDDHALSPSAFSIAFAIARHLNRRTGLAFPGREALAAMTGVSVRQVSDHVQALRDRGHLSLQRRRNQSTLYRPIVPQDVRPVAQPDVRKTAGPRRQDVKNSAARMCDEPHIGMCGQPQPNPLKEPSEIEPFEGARTSEELFAPQEQPQAKIARIEAEKATRRKTQHPLPDEWRPPEDAYDFGARIGLTADQVEQETERFRNHAKANDRRQADWPAAYRNWLLKAVEYRRPRTAQPNRPSALEWGVRAAMEDFE
jgi:hypothetical protein